MCIRMSYKLQCTLVQYFELKLHSKKAKAKAVENFFGCFFQ